MNRLLNDIKEYLSTGGDTDEISSDVPGVSQISGPNFVTDSRWYTYWEVIFAREVPNNVVTSAPVAMEYVGVTYAEGATEYQEADDEEPEVYVVEPVVVTETRYKKV
jgi:hypothetical protein